VNFAGNLLGLDQIIDGLKKFGNSVAAPAAGAAADALASEIARTRKNAGLNAPLERTEAGARREVGASDPASVAREFGTLETDPAPWLAPSLPAAQSPMRAAVVTAVARAISALRLNVR
jgi:hypothetical protein